MRSGARRRRLRDDDLKGLWTALDAPPTAQACRRWDLLHGRDVPSDAEIDKAARAHARDFREYQRRHPEAAF